MRDNIRCYICSQRSFFHTSVNVKSVWLIQPTGVVCITPGFGLTPAEIPFLSRTMQFSQSGKQLVQLSKCLTDSELLAFVRTFHIVLSTGPFTHRLDFATYPKLQANNSTPEITTALRVIVESLHFTLYSALFYSKGVNLDIVTSLLNTV